MLNLVYKGNVAGGGAHADFVITSVADDSLARLTVR
jgi:hypothetical protein